jgi:meiotic recombination protein SPO11
MARMASREVIESLGGFLRRSTALSDDDIRVRMKDLDEGRMRTPDSSSEAFRRALICPSTEATLIPDGGSPKNGGPSIPSGATKLEEPTAGRGSSSGSGDPRLAGLRARHATVRAPVAFPEHTLEAADVPANDVRTRLAHFNDYVATRVQAGELPCVDLPDLHRANSIYDHRGNVFLGHNVRRLAFDRQGGKAFMRLLLTHETASDNLRNGVCTTKRGLYYYHQAKLPDEDACQVDSDRALAALANMLGVRRKTLGFVEARRGIVWGRLVMRDGGAIVDLSQVGPAGYAIPRFTDDAEIVSSDAAFILIVEKHTVAFQLAQARWWEAARCIIVCGEGFPSMSAREYVRTLVDTLGIPALICIDADPSGIRVALTYAHGSISTALETPWLACNNIWWAGFYPSDIDRYCRSSDLIGLTDTDYEAARRLLEHPSDACINARVREELAILVDRGAKVELDAISRDMSRLVDDYLPKKLFDSDLVKL